MIRIVLYSNQPILAKGLESLIVADPALELSAYCSTSAALKQHMVNENPDLAVVDLTPEITFAMLGELQSLAPQCKLILWTDLIAGDFALQALSAGVRGVLRKTLPAEGHRQCLHKVFSGELWFEKSLTDSFRSARRVSLSPRESQLVSMLTRGLKNKEMSHELGITEGTVKVYLSHLFAKSGAKDRFDLAVQGLRNFGLANISAEGKGVGLRSLFMEPLCR
jgi:DNA-binding NarL/FixJ family response regulator